MQLNKTESNKMAKSPKTPKNKTSHKAKPQTPNTRQTPEGGNKKKRRRRRKFLFKSFKIPATGAKPQQNNQTTPNSNKRKRPQKEQIVQKKRKTDAEKTKLYNLNAQVQKSFADVKVMFPRSEASYKDVLLNVLDVCESVLFMPRLVLRVKHEDVKSKIEEIQKLKVDGKPLKAFSNVRVADPLKRVIYLKTIGADTAQVKKFFDAKSVDQLINVIGQPSPAFILSFSSEKAAAVASQKEIKIDGKKCNLKPYLSNEEIKEMKAQRSEKVEQDQKPQTKKEQKKKEQPKKEEKVEVEEEESEDDDEEEELDSDMEDIDADDDDEEEEEDDDDHDDDDDDEDDDE